MQRLRAKTLSSTPSDKCFTVWGHTGKITRSTRSEAGVHMLSWSESNPATSIYLLEIVLIVDRANLQSHEQVHECFESCCRKTEAGKVSSPSPVALALQDVVQALPDEEREKLRHKAADFCVRIESAGSGLQIVAVTKAHLKEPSEITKLLKLLEEPKQLELLEKQLKKQLERLRGSPEPSSKSKQRGLRFQPVKLKAEVLELMPGCVDFCERAYAPSCGEPHPVPHLCPPHPFSMGDWRVADTYPATEFSHLNANADAHKEKEKTYIKPEGRGHKWLRALENYVLAVAADGGSIDNSSARQEVFRRPDSVGAYAIHALLVSDTDASRELAMKLLEQDALLFPCHQNGAKSKDTFNEVCAPEWLLPMEHGKEPQPRESENSTPQVRMLEKLRILDCKNLPEDMRLESSSSDNAGDVELLEDVVSLFTGENCLHVVAANKRSDEFTQLVKLAYYGVPSAVWQVREDCLPHPSSDRVKALMLCKAKGKFLQKEPMVHYGMTPVSFAATFGLKDALKEVQGIAKLQELIQEAERLDGTKESLRCRLTGYLPLHAVIASEGVRCCEAFSQRHADGYADNSATNEIISYACSPAHEPCVPQPERC